MRPEPALTEPPTDPFATVDLAEQLEASGNLDRALVVWREIQKTDPDTVVNARVAALQDRLRVAEAPAKRQLPGRTALEAELGAELTGQIFKRAHVEAGPPPIRLTDDERTDAGVDVRAPARTPKKGPKKGAANLAQQVAPTRVDTAPPPGLTIVTWADLRSIPRPPPKVRKAETLMDRWKGLFSIGAGGR